MANNGLINIETATREEVDKKISAMRECGKIHGKLFQDLKKFFHHDEKNYHDLPWSLGI